MQNSLNINQTKTAVITGASSGIGRATALKLAGAGFQLLLCGRDESRLKGLKAEIQANGGEAAIYRCDVSKADQVADLVSFAAGLWPSVDLLFNNAGAGKVLLLENTPDALWHDTIGTVLSGTFFCCKGFLPLLKTAPAPLIINNASVAAHRGFPGFSAYSAAKGGVAAFSRSLREEIRPAGIRVTTLSAGATDTPFWSTVEGEWDRSRMMTADTVAEMIVRIAELPPTAQVEEILLMPSGGAL